MLKINLFTQQPYPDEFNDLSFNQTIPLTSIDLPYFAVRSFYEKRTGMPIGQDVEDFQEPFADISDGGWMILDISGSKSKTREYEFLENMALAVQVDGVHYISKFAYLLYDPTDGLFATYDSNDTAEEKKAYLAPLMRLFLTYILPGRWWRAFYARQYLPDTIGESTDLNAEMLELEEEWLAIAAEYGSPVETDAEPPAES